MAQVGGVVPEGIEEFVFVQQQFQSAVGAFQQFLYAFRATSRPVLPLPCDVMRSEHFIFTCSVIF